MARVIVGDVGRPPRVPVRVVVDPAAHHGFDRLQPVTLNRHYVGVHTGEAEDAWVRECLRKGARFGGDCQGARSGDCRGARPGRDLRALRRHCIR